MLLHAARHLRTNLVAYVALFFAMTSTGYAATKLLPPNTVGTRQVVNGSLLQQDFKAGQIPTPYLATFAWMDGAGALIASQGVTSATHPATGVYCFQLAAGGPKAAIGTVTGYAGLGNETLHTSVRNADACRPPNPSDAAAYIRLPSGLPVDRQFFIQFIA